MTFLEKIKLEKPDAYLAHDEFDRNTFMFGCPCNYGYEKDLCCPTLSKEDREKYETVCIACWNREIPEEKPETQIEKIAKGVQKKMKLAELIRDTVLNSICDRDIEEAVKDAFEEYDYSDLINRAVEDYLYCNIEDIANDIVVEAVRDYMAENL